MKLRCCAALAAAACSLPGAAQAAKPITGTLDQGWLTVMAMTRDGRVSASTAGTQGAFKIERNTLAPRPGRFLAPWPRSSQPG